MNYIGSKYSLLDFLQETMEDVTGYKDGDSYVFGDLFAGTGVVGQIFKSKGCKVIANDIQHYSYSLNKHLIENVPKMDDSMLDHLNSLQPIEGFVFISTRCNLKRDLCISIIVVDLVPEGTISPMRMGCYVMQYEKNWKG